MTPLSTLSFKGLGVHHMLPEYHQDHETYKKRLAELVPFFTKLSTKSRVIWMHQNPILNNHIGEFTGHYALYITQHLIEHYNEAARRILR